MNASQGDRTLLVVAGEESGDLHASHLCEQILKRVSQPLQVWGSGGDRLAALGARLLASSRQLAAIGPAAALAQAGRYCRLYHSILEEAQARRPLAAVLVDFPDFNLPLARALKKRGIAPIVYFISPQLWAWRQGRVRKVRNNVDKMIVLFPFEVDFYRAHGVTAEYYGHPLASNEPPWRDRQSFAQRHRLSENDVFVAVLPGSRRREVEAILPVVLEGAGMLAPARHLHLQLVIAAAPGLRREIERLVHSAGGHLKIKIIEGSDEVLAHCDYGLIKSGTSTLEAALAGLPFCMLYRGSSVSWNLVRFLLKTELFALPNLILKERAVPELVQRQANPRAVAAMLSSFVGKDPKWEIILQKLSRVRDRLAGADPYGDAATSIVRFMEGAR
ncbi:MAG: lipid-A-disaccharide synthase [Acidobacteria bacterium]|nr:lipid-A-disaccharide synthase [Acidobacteriota bacterium]